MIDVLHICYPGVGGQAAVATGLAVEATRAGSRQAVVFYGVEKTAQQYLDLCEDEGIDHTTIEKNPGIGFAARRKLKSVIKGYAPTIVIAHHHDTCITASLSFFLNKQQPTIFVEHHSNALKTRKDWILSTLAHRLSDHTVYLTESYRTQVIDKQGSLIRKNKTSVIGNGLDLHLYAAAGSHERPEITIGMQGRMDQGKDYKTLLDAFSRLQQKFKQHKLVLELIGDGPDRAKLESQASGEVNFTGFLPHNELIQHMSHWDIAVLSTDGETLSMAVLESWALAIPLVASDVPGIGDLIKNGRDGLLFEPNSPNALSEKISSLIENPSLGKQIAASGRKRVECDYDRRVIWQNYQQVIDQLTHPATVYQEPAKLDSLN